MMARASCQNFSAQFKLVLGVRTRGAKRIGYGIYHIHIHILFSLLVPVAYPEYLGQMAWWLLLLLLYIHIHFPITDSDMGMVH